MAHLPIKFEVATNVSAYEEMQSRFGAPDDKAAIFAKQTADNLNMSGVAGEIGQIQSNTGATRQNEYNNIKDSEKRNAQSREVLDAMRRIAEIDKQLAELYKIGEQIDKDIDATKARIKVLDNAIADPASIEFDEDGNIKDPKIASAVEDYKKRTGKDVDVTDMADLQAVLIAQRKHEQDILGGHQNRKQDNDSKIDGLKQDRGRQVKIIEQENPNANVEELVEKFKNNKGGIIVEAKGSGAASSVVKEAAEQSATNSISTVSDEDDFSFDDYDAFADSIDKPTETKVAENSTPEPDTNVQVDSNQSMSFPTPR